ncbi:hypothetical protein EYV94_18270 [Puteibacter caeruleilacunae]|nr:hypothetical protein EYV94_18270 [Puteibacter caeruleilacunae]
MKRRILACMMVVACMFSISAYGQITERERPKEWDNLIEGGRFMDRFMPIPVKGEATSNVWGAKDVLPRYVQNGIENKEFSYWGGNIVKGDDGKFHLFVCGWPENSPKGHMFWPKSIVYHAVSDQHNGPFKVVDTVGKGHNPEIFRMKDGRYVIYVINGQYVSDSLNGPWKAGKFTLDPCGKKIIEGTSNLTFARRDDGSFLLICRGGGVWLSKTGLTPFYQISDGSVYPPVEGHFEDPVVWKTNVQYHLIVNDWLGRIAYYLRSKDGLNWKVEPGEAYMPGITKYEDGTNENWFKYERLKVLQDKYGRAYQANFAVIDTIKWNDLPNDRHSSKNICIPLTKGRLMSVLNKDKINAQTKTIKVKIESEDGFDAQKDMDLKSLRFGASEEVNFGKGSKVLKTKKSGDDMIIFFKGEGNGLNDKNFAGKLLGKTKDGKLLFGYCRLPGVDYSEPAVPEKD